MKQRKICTVQELRALYAQRQQVLNDEIKKEISKEQSIMRRMCLWVKSERIKGRNVLLV